MGINRTENKNHIHPTGYIKAAFQWLNTFLDPIRNIWIRSFGSTHEKTNIKSLDAVDMVIVNLNQRVNDLEFYVGVTKRYLDSPHRTQALQEITHVKTSISAQKIILKNLHPSSQSSYLRRKQAQELEILDGYLDILVRLQQELGFATSGRDKVKLVQGSTKFGNILADVLLRVVLPRNHSIDTFYLKSTNPIQNFAIELAKDIFLPLSIEEIETTARAIENALMQRFEKSQRIGNPRELAHDIANKVTERLTEDLARIIHHGLPF